MTGQITQYFPMGGGLDLVTPPLALKPSAIIASKNYEPVLGGYRRIHGFERYSGRTSPTDADYWQIDFTGGTAIISAGDTVTGATSGATGVALADATVTSGAYGTSNAAGYLGLGAVTGTFVDGENLQVSAATKSQADGTAQLNASPDDDTAAEWQAQATANARALIAAVPGSGSVLGVWRYNGNRYAIRNNAGATAAVLHIAGASGWTAVTMSRQIAFTSGGTYEVAEGDVITGATSAATATVKRVVVTSGTWAAGDAAGYLVFDSQTGTFQAENLNVGANLNVASIAGNSAAITLPAGGRYEFINHNFYGTSSSLRMYGCNGVGTAFEFDGTTFCPIASRKSPDTPHRIAVHRQALLLGFPGGMWHSSTVGDPLSFDAVTGAAAFGIGDEITDFIANTTNSTVILGKNSVNVLYGSSSADYEVQTLSEEAGAFAWSADKVGQALYMDKGGIRSIAATQDYGNFALGSVSQMILPLIQAKLAAGVVPVGTALIRASNQYRLFFSDNTALAVNMGAKVPELMPLDLGKLVTCVCSVETDAGEEILFGSSDGYVYHLEKGTSFDGEEIEAFLRLPFAHLGSPQVRKKFHKVVIECDCVPDTVLNLVAEFDYGDASQLSDAATTVTLAAGGGAWDSENWDQFYWSSPFEGVGEAWLDGLGKNMSLVIISQSAVTAPHTLQGITYFYTHRGLAR